MRGAGQAAKHLLFNGRRAPPAHNSAHGRVESARATPVVPGGEDVLVVREGERRQGIRCEPPELDQIVAGHRLTFGDLGGEDGEHDALALSGQQPKQRTKHDLQPDLLARLADGGRLDDFAAIHVASWKPPLAGFSCSLTSPSKQEPATALDHERHRQLRIEIDDRTA